MTKPHTSYEDPGISVIRQIMESKKLKNSNEDVVLSAAHAYSHVLNNGSVNDAFVNDYTDPREEAIRSAVHAIDFKRLSGRTPLEKAISFAHIASESISKLESLSSIPLAQSTVLKDLQKLQDTLTPCNGKGGPSGEGGQTPEEHYYNLSPKEKAIFLAYKSIQSIPGLNFAAQRILREDPNGKLEKDIPVSTLTEAIKNASGNDMADPQFIRRLVDLDFDKTETSDYITVEQTIMLLIDDSGSMSVIEKQAYVQAICRFLKEKIDQGHIKLFMGRFERKIANLQFVTAPMEYYKEHIKANWGGTDVNSVIEEAFKLMETFEIDGVKFTSKTRPQLVIINDGQDTVDDTQKTPFPVHAISLEVENPQLQQLCKKSGGEFRVMYSQQSKIREAAYTAGRYRSENREALARLETIVESRKKRIGTSK
jgi:hypothetical protein